MGIEAKDDGGDGGCEAIGEGDGGGREIGKGDNEVEQEGANGGKEEGRARRLQGRRVGMLRTGTDSC